MTFTDLTALMLVFFVLMFSMSELDTDKWRSAVAAFNLRFNLQVSDESPRPQADENVSLTPARGSDGPVLSDRAAAGPAARHPALSQVRLVLWPDKLVISLPNQLLFRSSEAQLQPSGITALFALGGALARSATASTLSATATRCRCAPAASPRTGSSRSPAQWRSSRHCVPRAKARKAAPWATAAAASARSRQHCRRSGALGLARRVDIIVREGRGER